MGASHADQWKHKVADIVNAGCCVLLPVGQSYNLNSRWQDADEQVQLAFRSIGSDKGANAEVTQGNIQFITIFIRPLAGAF